MEKDKETLSLNQQIYIETVYALCNAHQHAHIKAISEKLGVKMASATEAVRNLAEKGIFNYQARKNITLTANGMEIAQRLDRRHQILSGFFKEILGCPDMRSEKFACSIEHVIDEDFLMRLAAFTVFMNGNALKIISEFQKEYNNASRQKDSSR
ncbi:MAG: hypothetical protein A2020_12515 [Lentisphaerae bacterium GWF2_45_14]|nr:MAG: hypothetical protein A2020_12515 [Lentisphaerae bacterium GWF2_45_14]